MYKLYRTAENQSTLSGGELEPGSVLGCSGCKMPLHKPQSILFALSIEEIPRGVLESPARALAKRLQAWEVIKLRLLTLEYLQPREMSQPTELAASPLPPHGSTVPRDPQTAVEQADVSCQQLGGLGGLHPPSATAQERRQSPKG